MRHGLAVGLAGWLAAAAAGQDLRQLAKFAPAGANELVLIDIAGLHVSAKGKADGWAKKHEEGFAEGTIPYPPGARAVMIAAQVDPRDWRTARFEAGALLLDRPVSMQRVLDHEGGILERQPNRQIVRSTRNRYLAPLGERILGAYHPAKRQEFLGWLREVDRGGALPPYLDAAFAEWPTAGQLVLALDMEGATDAESVAKEMASRLKSAELAKMSGFLAGIRGMRLAVKVRDEIDAVFRVTFSEPVGDREAEIRKMLAAPGPSKGAFGIDVLAWPMTVAGAELVFTAKLTDRQFADLLEHVQPNAVASHSAAPPKTSRSPSDALATQQTLLAINRNYFKMAFNVLNGLEKRVSEMNNYYASATEYDMSARRLRRLNTDNVDPSLVAFAENTGRKLEGIARGLRGVPAERDAKEAGTAGMGYYTPIITTPPVYGDSWSYPWRWGESVSPGAIMVNPTLTAREDLTRFANVEADRRTAAWQEIRDDATAVRRKMADKFNADF